MIDAYYNGKVNRISPEAPVPIVNITSKEDRLGGAANVALNIQALGANAILCGAIGKDEAGGRFTQLMNTNNLEASGIYAFEHRKTTVKSRVIGNQQQLVRLDEEVTEDLSSQDSNLFIQHLNSILSTQNIDAIILEDYDKGILCKEVIDFIVQWANQNNVITSVDPKKKHFLEYKGVTIFKPNLKELKEGLKVEADPTQPDAFLKEVAKLEEILHPSISLITLSEHGIFIKNEEEHHFIPAHRRNITDVSGAGDTVIAVATLSKVAGSSLVSIAALSNLAGGLACEKPGVVPISAEQIIIELDKLRA